MKFNCAICNKSFLRKDSRSIKRALKTPLCLNCLRRQRNPLKDFNVLWDRTKQLYGYDYNTIKYKAKLVADCTVCKKELTILYRGPKLLKRILSTVTHKKCKKLSNKHRLKATKASRKYWADPKSREIASQISAGLWRDDKYRHNVLKGLVNADNSIINWSYQKRSDKSKLRWNTPEYREKLLGILQSKEHKDLKRRLCTKEQREASRQFMIELWSNEDYRDHMATTAFWSPKPSKLQRRLIPIFKLLDIHFVEEYKIRWWSFDYFLPHHNILIEVQGEYWHSKQEVISRDKRKKTYVYNNTIHKLIYVYESEFKCERSLVEKLRNLAKTVGPTL